jgi:hypothetical protein
MVWLSPQCMLSGGSYSYGQAGDSCKRHGACCWQMHRRHVLIVWQTCGADKWRNLVRQGRVTDDPQGNLLEAAGTEAAASPEQQQIVAQ